MLAKRDSIQKKEYSLWNRVRKNKVSYLMLAPFALLFILFGIIPVLSAVFLSFTSFNMVQIPKFVGIANYSRLFIDDPIFLIALKNTVIFAVITGPIGYVLSFMIAWFINEFGRVSRSILTLVFYAPTLAGNIYFIWLFIFAGDSYGLANSTMMSLNIIKEPIQWLTDTRYNLMIVIVVVIWLSMGAGFLAFVAGLKTMNYELFEAASIDGIRNRWQELWYVTLPQMVPQLLFGAVMSISVSFAVGYQSIALTGFPSTNYSTQTLLVHILDYGSIRYEMGYASAIAVFLFAVMLMVWYFVNKAFSKLAGD